MERMDGDKKKDIKKKEGRRVGGEKRRRREVGRVGELGGKKGPNNFFLPLTFTLIKAMGWSTDFIFIRIPLIVGKGQENVIYVEQDFFVKHQTNRKGTQNYLKI